jgi:hypothetical protein
LSHSLCRRSGSSRATSIDVDDHCLVRRQRRREAVGGARHPQHLGDQAMGRDIAADRTVGLAQGGHVYQPFARHLEMFDDAAAGCAKHAGAVSIVNIDHGVPPFGEVQQVGDRRDVAVLAEDAVGHDDLRRSR